MLLSITALALAEARRARGRFNARAWGSELVSISDKRHALGKDRNRARMWFLYCWLAALQLINGA